MAKTKETEEQPADPVLEETQPTGEVKDETQPSIEDLRTQIAEEKERYDNLYKESQRRVSSIDEQKRKLGERAEILDTLATRLDSIEEYQAMQSDYLAEIRGTEGIEERPPTRRSHLDELRLKREQAGKVEKPKTETPVDPENLRATILVQGIIADMNWDMEHPTVKKILHLEDDPQEALKILRKEQKTQRDREADETVQRKLKESGVTTSETAGPSGQGTRSYTPAQIRAMPYAEYEENKESIEKAYRAGKIK